MNQYTPSEDYSRSEIGDGLLDRLVDGELSDSEFRGILAALEQEPGGWRRCAMAFLEAQVLARELETLTGQRAAGEGEQPLAVAAGKVAASATASGSELPWRWLAAVAASFLLALALGFAARVAWTPGPATKQQPIVDNDAKREIDQIIADAESTLPRYEPVGNVTLVVDGSGVPQELDVPVYDLQRGGAKQLLDTPALPPELVEQLQLRGHQVQTQEQWIPVEVNGRGTMLVPIEEVQITPVRGYPQ